MDGQVNEQSPLSQVAATSVCKSAHTYNCFKIGCIKSKSAIVVLFWTFSALAGYNLLNPMNSGMLYISRNVKNEIIIVIFVCIIISLGVMCISPLAGLLADIKFGRYKTLRCSSYVTLAVISFLSISFIVCAMVISIVTPHHIPRFPFVFIALILLATIGVLITSSIVLTTNAINFGMDQLHDSSTQDSILFVHWYVWLDYLSMLVTGVPWNLLFYDTWYLDYVDVFRIVSLSLFISIFGIVSFLLIVSLCGSSQTKVVLYRI